MQNSGKYYHFVGIGGDGMSGLAHVMLEAGCSVSGSDLCENSKTIRLRNSGAQIYLEHQPSNITDEIEEVIVSSAIDWTNNVEIGEAKKRELRILPRMHALSNLLEGQRSIGVAGTHGKTTTTAMIATILSRTGLDPTYLIGADCPHLGGNACLGRSKLVITEVDESDGLFLGLRPSISVLGNIDKDHMNTYKTYGAIQESFLQFVNRAEQSVLSLDDPNIRKFVKDVTAPFTIGIDTQADLQAVNIEHEQLNTQFDIILFGRRICRVSLSAPGAHNVRNALAAIGASFLVGVDPQDAAAALFTFQLPQRRFQILEENGVTVVDDYAHLPAEIKATLQAIRDGWNGRRIIAIFQPHRYSRTQALGAEFGSAFRQAEIVLVAPIYPAYELPIAGVSAQLIVDAIRADTDTQVYSLSSPAAGVEFLKAQIEPGDFIISFGAGDIWRVTTEISSFLKEGSFLPVTTGERR
ncbi:UDP-N-acetylmuramate--L-alanine ligase [Candidatus Acetothermia bacterium]|nr:UDP-N-acetylmuramate--L-alanine ligase [Candidatus Acetothermia bacterium]MCI2427701.1 UDP-N-acetylmuramate--L-alanine ligase [Candidatus Acetothermia bacterium]MCI2429019.1 UDP-N-acetylmuramate--L-alanine ligase [Candidatus Acetothermia bacterium]